VAPAFVGGAEAEPLPSPPRAENRPETASSSDERLFAPEATPGGCASGECLPPAEPDFRLQSVEGDVAQAGASAAPAAARPPPVPAAPAFKLGEQGFRECVAKVKQVSARHGTSLAHGRLLSFVQGEVAVAYPHAASFHRSTVAGQSGKVLIEKLLSEYFGAPTRLRIENDAAAAAAPRSLAEEEAEARKVREVGAEEKVRSHPALLSALRILGGSLEHIQVLEALPPALPAESEVEDS
jgi:hypothetical protein